MEFQPKSEAELNAEMVMPAGVYDFEVADAEDKQSQKGNGMIALNLKVFGPNGGCRYVRDWLVASDAAMCLMKIRHFCRSTDCLPLYESGTLDAMACRGLAGKVKVGIEESDEWGTQNRVVDYIAADADTTPPEPMPAMPSGQQQQAARAAAPPDDEVPF